MRKALFYSLVMVFALGAVALADGYTYSVKKEHAGGDLSPSEAYAMLQQAPGHTHLVDVRTRAEYQLIGHPEGACNVPLKFWTGKMGKKKYDMTANADFGQDLKKRFDPAADKLIFMCRSGSRSCSACSQAIAAGWPAENVFNLLGGFEGDKVKCKGSAFNGQRKLGGWRNEGLPWTYHVDKALVYSADLTQ